MDFFEREPLPVSLLRAPAAVAAGAFVVGVAVGAIAGPLVPATLAASAGATTFVVTLVVCVPFLLPTAWYRRHHVLWIWMAAAAAFVTMRAVFMAGFLLPYQPVAEWLLKVTMDLAAAAALWLATAAIRNGGSRIRD